MKIDFTSWILWKDLGGLRIQVPHLENYCSKWSYPNILRYENMNVCNSLIWLYSAALANYTEEKNKLLMCQGPHISLLQNM